MNSPKVSVCVVTYNQENYIYDCLESIVSQQTNFPFEIIIGNDASTDKTSEIVEQFTKKYPGIITYINREKNIGGSANYIDVHNQIQGEYVCHIDGDDLMLPNKLQTQADFLDANPQYSLVAHKMKIFTDDGKEWDEWVYNTDRNNGWEIKIEDNLLFRGGLFCHSSIMYQRKYRKTKIELWENMLDFFFILELLTQSNGFVLNNILGKYNSHSIGSAIFNFKKEVEFSYFKTLKYYLKKYPMYKIYIYNQILYSFLANLKNCKIHLFNSKIKLKLFFLALSKFDMFLLKKIYYFNQIRNQKTIRIS